MKNGRLNASEVKRIQSAIDVLNAWCDWEGEEREQEDFNPVLDDVECCAASAAGLMRDFLYMYSVEMGERA